MAPSLPCLLFVMILCESMVYSAGYNRHKRSIATLQKMIDDCSHTWKTYDLINHGNYCGYGGTGIIVDDADRCCYHHDHCYNRASQIECQNTDVLMEKRIRFSCAMDQEVKCAADNPHCARMVCDCDREFVQCLNTVQQLPDTMNDRKMVPLNALAEIMKMMKRQ